MKLHTVKDLLGSGVKNIVTNRLVAIVAATTVFISLTLFGIIYFMANIINANITNLQGKVEIVAFIEDDLKSRDVDVLKEKIEKIDNVESVRYISPEQGLEEYKDSFEQDGDKEMQRIIDEVVKENENPIPHSLSIKSTSTEENEAIKEEISSNYEEIYKINDGNVVTEFLISINKYTKIIGGGFMAVFIFASTILISNAIKVAVFVRRREIGIKKYIGATDNYIRLPFIIEGIILSVIGAVVSVISISLIYKLSYGNIMASLGNIMGDFTLPTLGSMLPSLCLIMLVISIGIGTCGSLLSLRKYLDV